MEHVPLPQADESPPFFTPEVKKSSKTVSKRTIVIAAIVILVLAVLVIVLGALLGAERAKRKGKIKLIFNGIYTTVSLVLCMSSFIPYYFRSINQRVDQPACLVCLS